MTLVETCKIMGKNFWPYGIEANRKEPELVMRYTHEHPDDKAASDSDKPEDESSDLGLKRGMNNHALGRGVHHYIGNWCCG